MADFDAVRLLHAALSPDEPPGTPPLPEKPDVQQQGLIDWFLYWAGRHESEAVTRVDTSRFMLAMGRFIKTVMLDRRYPLFGQANARIEGFGESLRGSIAEAHSTVVSLLTYFNFDDLLEQKKQDPNAVASMQRGLNSVFG